LDFSLFGTNASFLFAVTAKRFPTAQPLVVQYEPLDNILSYMLHSPLPEAGSDVRLNAVADGYDRIEIVKIHIAGNIAAACLLNY